jgi:hypothetical protein
MNFLSWTSTCPARALVRLAELGAHICGDYWEASDAALVTSRKEMSTPANFTAWKVALWRFPLYISSR